MSFKLGLTGSIGMGKSTTAQMFADMGCAVWDADAAVHRLYAQGGAAVAPMTEAFPSAVKDGAVDRSSLKALIAQDPDILKQIEAIVHPLVAVDRTDFINNSETDIVVLDIPLLFEMGSENFMDATVCVSAPDEVQKSRVMARGTMDFKTFETIRAKQIPNADKCARADYVVITDTLDHARAQVEAIVSKIREDLANA